MSKPTRGGAVYAGDAGATPLEVVYSPTFSALAEAHYDILLVGIPVSMRDLTPQQEKAKACAMTDNCCWRCRAMPRSAPKP
jgi:BarA-like signal transduction histidine kinase